MTGDGTWVGATGVLPQCRFRSPVSVLRSLVSGLRSPVSVLRSSVSGLWSPVFGLWSPLSGLRYPIGPRTPEKCLAACRHPRSLLSHWGGEKIRAPLLQEVLVQFLQVSQAYWPVSRFIGAATAPGIQPDQRLACQDKPANSRTPGASAWTACTGFTSAHLKR